MNCIDLKQRLDEHLDIMNAMTAKYDDDVRDLEKALSIVWKATPKGITVPNEKGEYKKEYNKEEQWLNDHF